MQRKTFEQVVQPSAGKQQTKDVQFLVTKLFSYPLRNFSLECSSSREFFLTTYHLNSGERAGRTFPLPPIIPMQFLKTQLKDKVFLLPWEMI